MPCIQACEAALRCEGIGPLRNRKAALGEYSMSRYRFGWTSDVEVTGNRRRKNRGTTALEMTLIWSVRTRIWRVSGSAERHGAYSAPEVRALQNNHMNQNPRKLFSGFPRSYIVGQSTNEADTKSKTDLDWSSVTSSRSPFQRRGLCSWGIVW